MLPKEHVRWLIAQPETVLSAWAVRLQRNGLRFMSIAVDFHSTTYFIEEIAGTFLRRNIDSVQHEIFDEIHASVDSTLGEDESKWNDLDLHLFLFSTVTRTITRVFFGLPTCRDERYTQLLQRFTFAMGLNTVFLGQLPPWIFKPVAGLLLNPVLWFYRRTAVTFLLPIITKRIHDLEADNGERNLPNDFLSQSIVSNFRGQGRAVLRKAPRYLAEQFLMLVSH